MLYATAQDWMDAPQKRVLIFAMSGLGKTFVSNMLRETGDWFHYSVDYRIGTRYMGEYIADNAKREAMKVPFLRDLLMSDSISLTSKISFENLMPVSSYLGKPGCQDQGGLAFEEYQIRQDQFRTAEIAALRDTGYFIDRASDIYGYPHFVCDTGGSICEWVDPADAQDPILSALAEQCLMIWIKGSAAHTAELVRRFDKAPKPMSYQPEFLLRCWQDYLAEMSMSADQVDPDAFVRWTYAQALAHRQPRYAAMAQNFGITIDADDMMQVTDADSFTALVGRTLAAQG